MLHFNGMGKWEYIAYPDWESCSYKPETPSKFTSKTPEILVLGGIGMFKDSI